MMDNTHILQTSSRLTSTRAAVVAGAIALVLSGRVSFAQSVEAQQPPAPAKPAQSPPPDDQTIRVKVPDVTVVAQKEPEDAKKLPVSVTAVSEDTIERAGFRVVSEASIFAPNTHYTEFTARKLSDARFRGIGSSPNNPAITTYIDGVPQINSNSSSLDLLDVEQIEFVRGGQSALFGRNTLGGLVNVTSRRPSLSKWTGTAFLPFGNFGSWEGRGAISGPIVADKLGVSFAASHAEREGFTTNAVTGHDLDNRSAFTGKGQVLWTPNQAWETRVIVTGERARDGDYGLNDLDALRQTPFQSSRDYEGFTHRDIFATTIQARYTGAPVVVSGTTGFVRWKTTDSTDLDYTAFPLIVRDNAEKDFLFTQEVRFASTDASRMKVSTNASLKWQAGVFLFTQNYDQDAVNDLQPALTQAPVAIAQHSPQAALDDVGVGFFGQGTLTLGEKVDLVAGARFDHESKDAALNTFTVPAIGPGVTVDAGKSFSDVSPQFAVSYRVRPEAMIYGSVARGFKAGGFNPVSPADFEAYGEEHTWNYEGGVKSTFADGRVSASASAFYIDWDDLQLNLPDPFIPASFYIANVGAAGSSGVEFALNTRPAAGVDVFGAVGYTRARFKDGARSSGADVDGNKLPNMPDYTASFGAQYAASFHRDSTCYVRGDVVVTGSFKYDDTNLQGQDSYALVNLHAGLRAKKLLIEGWAKNVFDTTYIPVAFQFGLARSGFLGENGAPRTFGMSVGVAF
jgi:iron complex outermembrane recepter protein